jgi:hypothetical protein
VTAGGMLYEYDGGYCSLHEVLNISGNVCTPLFMWFVLITLPVFSSFNLLKPSGNFTYDQV